MTQLVWAQIRNGDDKQHGDIRRRNNCFGCFVRPIIKMVVSWPRRR